jgi:hypothetical protein
MATTEEKLAEMKREIERQDAELEATRDLALDLRFVPNELAQAHLRVLDDACEPIMVVGAHVSMPFAVRA